MNWFHLLDLDFVYSVRILSFEEELTHKKVLAVYSNIEVKSTKNLNEIKEYLENAIGYEINFGKKIGD